MSSAYSFSSQAVSMLNKQLQEREQQFISGYSNEVTDKVHSSLRNLKSQVDKALFPAAALLVSIEKETSKLLQQQQDVQHQCEQLSLLYQEQQQQLAQLRAEHGEFCARLEVQQRENLQKFKADLKDQQKDFREQLKLHQEDHEKKLKQELKGQQDEFREQLKTQKEQQQQILKDQQDEFLEKLKAQKEQQQQILKNQQEKFLQDCKELQDVSQKQMAEWKDVFGLFLQKKKEMLESCEHMTTAIADGSYILSQHGVRTELLRAEDMALERLKNQVKMEKELLKGTGQFEKDYLQAAVDRMRAQQPQLDAASAAQTERTKASIRERNPHLTSLSGAAGSSPYKTPGRDVFRGSWSPSLASVEHGSRPYVRESASASSSTSANPPAHFTHGDFTDESPSYPAAASAAATPPHHSRANSSAGGDADEKESSP